MLKTHRNQLVFSFPEIHPNAVVTIEFQRTLRIPDDDKTYPLPPGLGAFPLKHVDDHEDRVPEDWKKRGGVMLPMYQSEALWVRFMPGYVGGREGTSSYPFAIKVAAGKMSAITGEPWRKKLNADDYVTIPKQKWIDGFVVKKGVIKQFVAMPLGEGYSVEEQLTGKAEFGGIQIEVFPMKRKVFDRRFPERQIRQESALRGLGRRSRGAKGGQAMNYCASNIKTKGVVLADARPDFDFAPDMSLGAGGSMKQEIYPDPYDIKDWKKKVEGNRCFVHLANTVAWKGITGENPPHRPPTAADYSRAGLPWFDWYDDDSGALKGTKALKKVKSVVEVAEDKKVSGLIENESCKPDKPVNLGPDKRPKKKRKKDQVRDGSWG